MVSHWTPVWFLANWPHKRVGLASYAADFAAKWGRDVRNSIQENEEGLGIHLSRDLGAASNWQLSDGGGMLTAGVGGPFTGYGFDLLLIDDPIKNRQEANSSTLRQHLWEWWRSTARTRLEPNGSIIIIQTRWHEDDLIGRLLNPEFVEEGDVADNWTHIRFPALAEPDDPLEREEDEPLWPGRYNSDSLRGLRIAVGPQEWPGLFQQRPTAQSGGVFKDYWWQWLDQRPVEVGRITQYWDTAFKVKTSNDYCVCTTMGEVEGGYVVLDVWRGRLEYPDLIRQVIFEYEKHRPTRIGIEDAASGQSAIQTLQRETRLPVVPVPVDKDKVSRANAVTGFIEAGQVFLLRDAPWVMDFVSELSGFPNGTYDDQVDSFVGALDQMIKGSGGLGGIYL